MNLAMWTAQFFFSEENDTVKLSLWYISFIYRHKLMVLKHQLSVLLNIV